MSDPIRVGPCDDCGEYICQCHIRQADPTNQDTINYVAALSMIQAERIRQRAKWPHEYDDAHHIDGEIALAAAYYAADESLYVCRYVAGETNGSLEAEYVGAYPWDNEPLEREPDRLAELAKAGALILAEMERLMRVKR